MDRERPTPPAPRPEPHTAVGILAGAALAAGVFVADLLLPLGHVAWLAYGALVLGSLWSSHRHAPALAAGASTFLILLGFALAPPGGPLPGALLRRGLGIAVLWVMAILCHLRKRAERPVEARARQQALAAELGRQALGALDQEALMAEALKGLAAVLEAEYCAVLELLPDGRGMLLRAGVGWKEGSVGRVIVGTGSDSQAGFTLLSDAPVIVRDLRRETRFTGPSLLREHGVVGGVSVIIPGRARPFGVLGVHSRRRRAFSPEGAVFLRTVANVLGLAIEGARAGAALRESEERHRSLTETAADAILIIDGASTIVSANPAATRLFGYALGELVGRDLTLLMPEELREPHRAGLRRYLAMGERRIPWTAVEFPALHRDGRRIPVEISYAELTGGDRRLFVGILRDLTERKQGAEAQTRIQTLLFENEKLAALGQLLAGVAREINNPLATILAQVDLLHLLRAQGKAAVPLERLEPIAEAVDRCARVVRDFLAAAPEPPLEPRPVAIGPILAQTHRLLVSSLRENGASVTLDLPEGLPPVLGDPQQLRQVMFNLLFNALHAAIQGPLPRGITVAARWDPGRDWLIVSFTDTGPGIPQEVQRRLFDPFFTCGPAEPGTAFGLSLCGRIVRAHGGSIQVESERGRGATFRVELPIHAAPALLAAG